MGNQSVSFLSYKILTSYKRFRKIYEVSPTKESFEFINPNNEPVYVKIGISAVDEKGAKQNLEQEIGKKSFEEVKREHNKHGKVNYIK